MRCRSAVLTWLAPCILVEARRFPGFSRRRQDDEAPVPPPIHSADQPPADDTTTTTTTLHQAELESTMESASRTLFANYQSIDASLEEAADQFANELAAAVDQATAKVESALSSIGVEIKEHWQHLADSVMAVLLYQPPVGIVAVLCSLRLIVSGRLFQWQPRDSLETKAVQAEAKERRLGRAMILDESDISYASAGGPWAVRKQLCQAAVDGMQKGLSESHRSSLQPVMDLLAALSTSLLINCRPSGARLSFLRELIEPLSLVEARIDHANANLMKAAHRDLERLVRIAYWTLEVRATDAVLRLCRDRLLKSSYRLARTKEHWQRRVQGFYKMSHFLHRLFHRTVEGDRKRLSYAEAAYHAEVQRLGRVVQVLTARPVDMDESFLLAAMRASDHEELQQPRSKLASAMSSMSQYSIRWNADGKGRLSIRKLHNGALGGTPALEALFGEDAHWINDAEQWTMQARGVLCNVLHDTLRGSTDDSSSQYNEADFGALETSWCQSPGKDEETNKKTWTKLVDYVDSLSSWRRVGEGKAVRLADSAIVDWTKRLDFLGIPSSLLWVWGAHYVHKWAKPHWPQFRKDMIALTKKLFEIFVERVWVPAKGIFDDLMNRNKGIMSALGVQEEQASLDRMLRDLGCGDGTSDTRQEALQKATEQYEHDISKGLMANLVRGRLIRLMLVQVQQLKVGLLSALDTIDVLMKGNRIHFQLLAAIPAVLLVYVGTRIFARTIYNIRAKDLRPVTKVHSDMGEYLNEIEAILLLGEPVTVDDIKSPKEGITNLSTPDLGIMALTIHRYLILLDFASPPFPSGDCDQIHTQLRQLVAAHLRNLPSERQVSWLHVIQKKHQDLLQHL